MSIPRSTRIGELYDTVSRFDLVVVPDSPLADALNRRLDQSYFGTFAITPRRLASRRREAAEDRTAFLTAIQETELSWKEVSYAVGNILQCWEYEGSADSILEYPGYETRVTREVLDAIESVPTSSRLLTEYRIQPEMADSVAVVGEQQLTNLERSILPDDYDVIERFEDDAFELPPFRIFESAAAIVDAVLDTVTRENAGEVAVVLDAGSEYSPLIESALETAGIPYYGGPGFLDERDHRAFLQLLRCTIAGSDTRVASVKPLLSCLGVDVSVKHDEKRLMEVSESGFDWLQSFIDRTETLSFGDALTAYEEQAGRTLDAFREELREVSLLDKSVTEDSISRLSFYLETYEVPVDRENEGVLLADAKSASFVDRPVVFFLGLDESWTHSSPKRPWIDRDEEFTRNLANFQSLLQSGVEQYYLVQDSAGGSPVTPCLYFEELLDTEFERFSDLESVYHARSGRSRRGGFEREALPDEVECERVTTVSQSSLNSYVNSPRDYLFGRLVDSPDKDYFKEGNLFHDFAEFAVNHPAFFDEDSLDEVVKVLLDETRPFHRGIDTTVKRTEYRVGLEMILEYLDAHAPTDTAFLTPESGWGRNFFAEYFDREVDSPVTERWFEDEELSVKGKIDLVRSPTQLVDFKSGSKNSAFDVTKHASLREPSEKPNFQALLYLTYWRQQQPNCELEFTFFHFLETIDDVVTSEASLDDCLTTVTYRPTPFDEFVETRAVFDGLCEEAANDCNKTFRKTNFETYRDVVTEFEIPRTRDADEMAETPFGKALRERLLNDVGDYKYVKKGCMQAFRHLCRYRKAGFFEDDLDEFERFVSDQRDELNRCRDGTVRFPVEGRAGEPNYRRVDHRDMLLTEEQSSHPDTGTEPGEESMEGDLGVGR